MEYRYFSGKKESNFRKLSGETQRAIETQVNIELEARKQSKYLGQSYQLKSVQDFFFNNKCDEYSNAEPEVLKRLRILDCKYLYLFPLTKDRQNYWISKAKEESKRIDDKIDFEEQLQMKQLRSKRNVER